MQTPMVALPELAASEAAAEEAAAEEAVEAAVELLELPQAVIAAAAPTTAEAFRKSRREIIFMVIVRRQRI